ncbi:MAG: LysR family transcriptional regulator [Solirubrobacteraceae bacterium]
MDIVAPGMDLFGRYLDPQELAAFVAAIESGTVSGAADALELTQSAVSKRLQGLERRLGTSLLERGRFGVRATDGGRLLYPEAKQALSALSHAAGVLTTYAAHSPTLRLAASHTIGGFLLPGWLAGYRAGEPTPPRAHVEIINSQGVLASVRDGHVEIGFIESLDAVDGLETMTIQHDEIAAVVASNHPWARLRAVPATLLAREPYLTREQGSGTRAVAAAALSDAGASPLEPTLETASTQSLKRAVLDGGFTLISRLAVEAEIKAGTLRALAVTGVDLTRPLRAVRRRRPALPADATRFWRFLSRMAA